MGMVVAWERMAAGHAGIALLQALWMVVILVKEKRLRVMWGKG